jgi:hypothetical protein
MMNEHIYRLKDSALAEARKLVRIFVYIWAVLILFSFHRALIIHDDHLTYHQGFALINALALAKVVLLAENLPIMNRFRDKPLIYPIIFKSAALAVILLLFHVAEEAFIGLVHGKTLSDSVPNSGGYTLQGIAMVEVITFVMLIPFFAFMELERAIGPTTLSRILFGRSRGDSA